LFQKPRITTKNTSFHFELVAKEVVKFEQKRDRALSSSPILKLRKIPHKQKWEKCGGFARVFTRHSIGKSTPHLPMWRKGSEQAHFLQIQGS
jgi:hypothetical protein